MKNGGAHAPGTAPPGKSGTATRRRYAVTPGSSGTSGA
jgi:hypothetical protein